MISDYPYTVWYYVVRGTICILLYMVYTLYIILGTPHTPPVCLSSHEEIRETIVDAFNSIAAKVTVAKPRKDSGGFPTNEWHVEFDPIKGLDQFARLAPQIRVITLPGESDTL